MKYIFIVTCLILLVMPLAASGENNVNLNLTYPKFPGGGPDINKDQSLSAVVGWAYYTIVGISGFAAFIVLVLGGMQWIGSAGNPTTISDAKDRIQNALLGLLLVLGSFILLQLINPGFLNLIPPFPSP